MSAHQATGFGRRRPATEAPAAPPALPVGDPETTGSGLSTDAIIELRNLCLARLEPAAVAAMPPERLTVDVERLLSEIATDRRIQLNAREQHALAGELVHDILGLGPLEPLLEDDTINDIMVNGPNKTFIERYGKVVLSNVKFRDTQHLANICQRIASAVGRRIDESSPMVDARLADGSRVNIVFLPLALD
ncbi:MAG TPA: ATPase, T2SS/T4P/T4SS family, partial [Acetobacteraceae bacterium]|nr:ATPase, T2SS/T4P/T4SS family [Acetobacteraceae bacterium]